MVIQVLFICLEMEKIRENGSILSAKMSANLRSRSVILGCARAHLSVFERRSRSCSDSMSFRINATNDQFLPVTTQKNFKYINEKYVQHYMKVCLVSLKVTLKKVKGLHWLKMSCQQPIIEFGFTFFLSDWLLFTNDFFYLV